MVQTLKYIFGDECQFTTQAECVALLTEHGVENPETRCAEIQADTEAD